MISIGFLVTRLYFCTTVRMCNLLTSGTDLVNNKQLRTQFSRLALLRACAVLYRNQDKLRSVLLQPTPSLDVALGVTASELGGALGMPSAATLDDVPASEDSDVSAGGKLLMHQLMLSATQPSPLKSTFGKDDLEVSVSSFAYAFFQ